MARHFDARKGRAASPISAIRRTGGGNWSAEGSGNDSVSRAAATTAPNAGSHQRRTPRPPRAAPCGWFKSRTAPRTGVRSRRHATPLARTPPLGERGRPDYPRRERLSDASRQGLAESPTPRRTRDHPPATRGWRPSGPQPPEPLPPSPRRPHSRKPLLQRSAHKSGRPRRRGPELGAGHPTRKDDLRPRPRSAVSASSAPRSGPSPARTSRASTWAIARKQDVESLLTDEPAGAHDRVADRYILSPLGEGAWGTGL